MSDSARKRKLADFVVAWKKQIVKLYAVAKWSRDANVVQKCMVRSPCHLLPGFNPSHSVLEHYGIPHESKSTI